MVVSCRSCAVFVETMAQRSSSKKKKSLTTTAPTTTRRHTTVYCVCDVSRVNTDRQTGHGFLRSKGPAVWSKHKGRDANSPTTSTRRRRHHHHHHACTCSAVWMSCLSCQSPHGCTALTRRRGIQPSIESIREHRVVPPVPTRKTRVIPQTGALFQTHLWSKIELYPQPSSNRPWHSLHCGLWVQGQQDKGY